MLEKVTGVDVGGRARVIREDLLFAGEGGEGWEEEIEAFFFFPPSKTGEMRRNS